MPQLPEIHRRDGGDALFGHIDPVNRVHRSHGRFVVGDDNELGISGKLADDAVELLDVRVVERGVHLVEDAEGRGFEQVEREEQGGGGERLFAAGELGDGLRALAFGLGDDVDVRFERRVGIAEDEVGGVVLGEERAEHRDEVFAHLRE